MHEAGAAATIYRLADGLGDETASTVRNSLTGYIKVVMNEEWPAMERGGASPTATRAWTASTRPF